MQDSIRTGKTVHRRVIFQHSVLRAAHRQERVAQEEQVAQQEEQAAQQEEQAIRERIIAPIIHRIITADLMAMEAQAGTRMDRADQDRQDRADRVVLMVTPMEIPMEGMAQAMDREAVTAAIDRIAAMARMIVRIILAVQVITVTATITDALKDAMTDREISSESRQALNRLCRKVPLRKQRSTETKRREESVRKRTNAPKRT